MVPAEDITRGVAQAGWYPANITLVGSNRRAVLQLEKLPEEGEEYDPKTYRWNLAVHSACEEIASRVMQTSREASIRSIGDLWITLERRCVGRTDGGVISYLPTIPSNRPGEPLELGLDRYYIPSGAIPGDHVDYDDNIEEWVCVRLLIKFSILTIVIVGI